MDKNEKRADVLKKVAKDCEFICGIDAGDLELEKTFREQGMNEPDQLTIMLKLEETFNKEISDEGFNQLDTPMGTHLWINRPVSELVEFCVDNLYGE